MHLLRVQGFSFTRMQYSPIQAFTARFAALMQLYRPRPKTAHRALQWLFLRLRPLNRPRYQTDTTSHCAACATLDGITAPGRAQPIPDTTATPGRCTGQHSPPIIIMYIRGQTMPAAAGSAPIMCGSLASAAPGAPAEGVSVSTCTGSARRGLDAFHARRLEV